MSVINCSEPQAALHERLEKAAESGNLTANLIEEAMRVFWPAETNPMYVFVNIEEPVLMRWLVAERFKRSWSVFGMSTVPCENIAIKEFGRFLGEGVEEFFRRFIADVRIAPRTIFNTELLKLIPAERRTMYFRDVYEKYSNTKFFGIRQFARAAAVGVDKLVLQELLLARIETIPAPKSGIGSELSEFVELRAELIPSNLLTAAQKLLPQEDKRRWWTGEYSPWEVLTNEQLFGAMRTCAQKIPESILGRTQVLALRLNEAQICELCELAANQLCHVSWDSAFRRYVSEATRFALLERCLAEPHGSQYGNQTRRERLLVTMLNMATELAGAKIGAFLSAHQRYLLESSGQIDLSEIYRRFWRRPEERSDGWEIVERWLQDLMVQGGYCFGTLVWRTYYNRRWGCDQRNLAVHRGDTWFVHEEGSCRRNWSPREGDVVIFHPKNGRQVATGVVFVRFTPAEFEGQLS